MVENSHGRIEEVLSIDISPTLLGLASFITRFDSPDIFRIKQKFCSLCDCVCGRAGNLSIRKDNDIRRDILDIILEWIVPPDVNEKPTVLYFCIDFLSSHQQIMVSISMK